jgi:UDP-hydrolysing UDP-N-acetyl-D-glucosamine 2-epimerase
MKKILLFTFSRADFGYLNPLIYSFKKNKKLKLELVVSGTHLDKEFGKSVKELKLNNVKYNYQIKLNYKNDTPKEITNIFAQLTKLTNNLLNKAKPDLIILFGDRIELLAVASASIIYKIPLAHIYGGEITQGSIDDAIRNAITKLSHLHFVRKNEFKNRLIQLGEAKNNIHMIGNLSEENFKKINILNKSKLEKELKIKFQKKNLLITMHPETIFKNKTYIQIRTLLKVLKNFRDFGLFFTLPNYDNETNIIKNEIIKFTKNFKNAQYFKFLGHKNYLSLLKNSDCVIGNSSSGVIEAPYLRIPTINIGKRQSGRENLNSIINVDFNEKKIYRAIDKIVNKKKILNFTTKKKLILPSKKILKKINSTNLNEIFFKKFIDLKK